jgi:hypothetical protein
MAFPDSTADLALALEVRRDLCEPEMCPDRSMRFALPEYPFLFFELLWKERE